MEDFLLSELRASLDEIQRYNIMNAFAPEGRRTKEDVIAEWECHPFHRQRLLISLKGHRAGSASNPNLASLQKVKAFYGDHPENCHFILVVLHYHPECIVKDGFQMRIQGIGYST